jgi:hypothetical protein
MTERRKEAKRLTADQAILLREVFEKHAPELMSTVLPRALANTLELDERLHVGQLITYEFAATGVGQDQEPTPRGYELEELLSAFCHPDFLP